MPRVRTVLFVGRRRRALAAARALRLEVVCVDETPPAGGAGSAGIARFLRHPLSGDDWAQVAREAAAPRRIDAVYALTERAVLPAARLRELLGLPGDSPAAARRATDKLEMKRAAAAAGIPCARFVDAAAGLGPDELAAELGLPLVVKTRVGSGGRHNRVCRRRRELAALADGWMAESFVDGVEMSVESLVADGRVVFSNVTEYFRVRWANIVPAALPPDVGAAVAALNARAVAALGLETAFCHLELFLTAAGPVFSELAARPPGGYITELIELTHGFDPWRAWLRLGLGEEVEPLPPPRRAAGVWLLHPGPGVVERVTGREAARELPGVERVKLRLAPGMTVGERLGAGQEQGHLLVTGRDRDEVARRLSDAHRAIRITMKPGAG